jgi:hypothetical protein
MDLLPARQPRIAPYIYTEQEIAALMSAAGRLGKLMEVSAASPDL